MRSTLALFFAVALAALPTSGWARQTVPAKLTPDAINAAELSRGTASRPLKIKLQVLLDRARFSPGLIDGQDGENVQHAIAAFQKERGLNPSGTVDEATWGVLKETSNELIIVNYTLSKDDADIPLLDKLPTKMEEQADLKRLSYTSVREAIAEKFHMSEALLRALNPKASFEEPGETIAVLNVAKGPLPKVDKLEVLKTDKQLRAIDGTGKLVAVFPATVGGGNTPTPSGPLKVAKVARNPSYVYNPDYAFKSVKSKTSFEIKPGPNNPVGTIWIDLGGDGYGIHGTPDPDKIGKTFSHGCVRLTNWDAEALASAVKKGTVVEFVD
jgi:lipoprotein-anchoring transpeptidase ErfK/SrfK